MMETLSSWHSYPSIYNLGHAALDQLLSHPLQAEEKIDGSQFSFGRFDGELKCRSKGQQIVTDAPEGLFKKAVESVAALDLHDGWTYRGECVSKPKHNTLCYARVPAHNVILFDINPAQESYLSYAEKAAEAKRVGLEVVPLLATIERLDVDAFRELLDRESVLGNTKIEGVVLKPIGYDVFGPDHKCLMAKFVSEAFKEKHKTAWKESNPNSGDILADLTAQLKTEARWRKAIQHLAEAGELENSPRDIGKLLKEIGGDVLKEEEAFIAKQLMQWAWPRIQRGIIAGFPEWYKSFIAESQLERLAQDAEEEASPC